MKKQNNLLRRMTTYSAIGSGVFLILSWICIFLWGFGDLIIFYTIGTIVHYLFDVSIIILLTCGVIWAYKKFSNK